MAQLVERQMWREKLNCLAYRPYTRLQRIKRKVPAMSITTVTFNLLHPIHGQNWDELIMRRSDYNEAKRIDGTVDCLHAIITRSLRDGNDVLCIALQEVSQPQMQRLVLLAAGLNGHVAIVQLDDMPVLKEEKRRAGYTGFAEQNPEYEMVMVFGAAIGQTESNGAMFEGGNGYIAVDIPERSLTFVSTHISFGTRRRGQIRQLEDVAARSGMRGRTTCIVGGDFNCTAKTVRETCSLPCEVVSATSPTRIGKSGAHDFKAAETIDHFIVFGKQLAYPVVRVHETDVDFLSDHRPVEVVFE